MSAAARILETARAAGYEVKHSEVDDVHRLYVPAPGPWVPPTRLVGMVIIREGRVVYAELRGRLFAWWPDSIDAFTQHLKETPA